VGKEEIATAIRERGDTVLEALRRFAEDAEEINIVGWAGDGGYWFWPQEDTLDEYERKLNIILNSKYADEDDKQEAQKQMAWVAGERQKRIEKEARKKLIRKRRSQFQSRQLQLMLALIERDGYKCAECGEADSLSIDHIIPLSRGGSDDLGNLRIMCRKHNSAKGDRVPQGL
jgi:hypothetical protein